MKVRKKQGKLVKAYCLGEPHPVITELMEKGLVVEKEDVFELFSQEAVNGAGELAYKGDYLKVDSAGNPYPNGKEWFENNHKLIAKDTYEQIPAVLNAWTLHEGDSEEIKFLVENGKMTINENDEEKYFNAFLWGADLSAPKDSIVVFYGIERGEEGQITEVDFNFVRYNEFVKTYDIV